MNEQNILCFAASTIPVLTDQCTGIRCTLCRHKRWVFNKKISSDCYSFSRFCSFHSIFWFTTVFQCHGTLLHSSINTKLSQFKFFKFIQLMNVFLYSCGKKNINNAVAKRVYKFVAVWFPSQVFDTLICL